MKNTYRILIGLAGLFACMPDSAIAGETKPPNIVIILADDMEYYRPTR